MHSEAIYDRKYRTQFSELVYARIDRKHWSFFTTDTDSRVGPLYASKAELLADLARYACENWGLR